MSSSTIYRGLDVHKESITVAVLPAGAPAPTRVERLPNDLAKLRRLCERLVAAGELRACYEASGAGYEHVVEQVYPPPGCSAWG